MLISKNRQKNVEPCYGQRASAPNYNQFFAQQEAIDPDFASRRELAWQNYLNYVNDHYASRYIEGFQHEVIPQVKQEAGKTHGFFANSGLNCATESTEEAPSDPEQDEKKQIELK